MVSLCIIRTLKFFAFGFLFIFPLVFMFVLVRSYLYVLEGPRKLWKVENKAFNNLTKAYDRVPEDYKKQRSGAELALKEAKKNHDQVEISQLNSILKRLQLLSDNTKLQHKNLSSIFGEFTDNMQKHKHGYLQYLMALVALYWMSDLINIGAVGFIPLTIGPVMRILQAEAVIPSYMRSPNMMILCGSIVVLGALPAGLAKRISFRILSLCGNNKRRLALCVMLISLIFSIWWVNTAVMVFMSSVIDEIVHELREGISMGTLGEARMLEWNEIVEIVNQAKARKKANKDDLKKHVFETPIVTESENEDGTRTSRGPGTQKNISSVTERVVRPSVLSTNSDIVDLTARGSMQLVQIAAFDTKKKLSFGHSEHIRHEQMRHEARQILEAIRRTLHHCAAVMCSVGGLFWTYNSTNTIQLYHQSAIKGFSSVDWTMWSFPIMCITIPFIMFCLDLSHFGPNFLSPILIFLHLKDPEQKELDVDVSYDTAEEILWTFQDKYYELGPMTSHEKFIIILMIIFIILLLIRMAGSPTGAISDIFYHREFPRKSRIDDASILAIAVVLGFFFPVTFKQIFARPKTPTEKPTFPTLLDWKPIQQHFPWGVLIVVGASTSLAEMYNSSGLDVFEINRFKTLHHSFGKEITLFIAILYTVLVSNTVGSSCGAIFAARFLSKVDSSCYYSLPCVTATSFAFLFPVGTSTMTVASLKMDGIHGWYCFKKGFIPSVVCPLIIYIFGLSYANLFPCTYHMN